MNGSNEPAPQPQTTSSPASAPAVPFSEQPLMTLLTADVSKMTQAELTAFVTELQRMRIPATLKAACVRDLRLDEEDEPSANKRQAALDLL